jgi:hypothetical protein
MSTDPAVNQHASRPGLTTYLALIAVALGVLAIIYAESLKDLIGLS